MTGTVTIGVRCTVNHRSAGERAALSYVDALTTWSGWGFGAFSFAVALQSLQRESREKQRSRRMAEALGSRPQIRPSLPVESQRVVLEQRVRAMLVHAAAGAQPLAVVLARAKRDGVEDGDVLTMVEELHRSGLLTYDGTLSPATVLTLRK